MLFLKIMLKYISQFCKCFKILSCEDISIYTSNRKVEITFLKLDKSLLEFQQNGHFFLDFQSFIEKT